MYIKESKRLDDIIDTTIGSIETSNNEIKEISHFAKKEYQGLEDEFLRLRIDASDLIDRVERLDKDYRISKSRLLMINKNYQSYSEAEMKEIYESTDALRVQIAVEKEREINLIRRRNELEIHLKSVRMIAEKADKLSTDFEIAYGVLTGNLKEITEKIGDIQNKEIWGLRVIQAQEAERSRVARDLHDGPAQSLSNLMLKTELCLKVLDIDIDRAKTELHSLKTLIRGTIDDTRGLIYNLRPMSIDDLGLIPTLERFIDQIEEKNDFSIELKVKYDSKDQQDKISDTISVTAFRIIQESLNNIQKYAKANQVIIEVCYNKNDLVIIVQDNGVGFNVAEIETNLKDNQGFGLSMMKERVNLLLGKFVIKSELKKGTVLHVTLPFEKVPEVKEKN
jgi:two-component system, NarL family, sensor histidine kinase DegS